MSFESIILAAAKTAKVSGALLLAICTHESGLKNVLVPHDNGSPTYGICQVKYETAKMMGYQGLAEGLMNPKTNATYASKYLKYQKVRYGGDWCKVTSAYNAGTYFEIEKGSRQPKNFQYVKKVQQKLQGHLQDKLSCAIVESDGKE